MRLLKPHKWYSSVMSENVVLIKLPRFQLTVQEFLDPHWLEFMYWKKDKDVGSYILKKWKKIPLNKKARLVIKIGKLDDERKRLRAHLDKISEKR